MFNMRKIEILDKDEQFYFDNPPVFILSERRLYFTLPEEVARWAKDISSPIAFAGFILLYGYAKSKLRFYHPDTFLPDDIEFVCNSVGMDPPNTINFDNYNHRTYNYHKQIIRKYLQIRPFNEAALNFFTEAVQDKVARHQSPKQILYEVAELCIKKRIEVPGYNRFTAIISAQLGKFEINLSSIVKSSLTVEQKHVLKELTKLDSGNNYPLTRFKTINQERNPASIRESIKDFLIVKNVYQIVLPLIQKLNLHPETIKFFATWIRKASNFQIQQLNENKRFLYMICFIYHQYCLRQDYFADILLLSVRGTENKVNKSEKEVAHQNNNLNSQTIKLLSNSRISYKQLIKRIDSIIKSILPDANKIEQIDQLLSEYRSQQPQEDAIDTSIQLNLEELSNVDYYTLLENESLKLQNRVADIMRYLEFEENDTVIYKAIAHYQARQANISKSAPINFMSTKDQEQFPDNDKFRKSLYKALLYFYAADALRAGVISLKPSYRYLSLENYLYPYDKWQRYKDLLLEELQLADKQDILILLEQFKQEIDNHYNKTNQNIQKSRNPNIKFDTKNRLILNTPKVEKPDIKSVASLFAECKYVPILRILTDIQQVVDYLGCLRHLSVKEKQVLPSAQVFYAAILGLGCNIGISKMASVSKGISEDILTNLVNWHLSVDNLRLTIQKILEFLEKLSLTYIHKDNQLLHTSSDGRKIKIAVDSLNANSSYKYFGKDMGIVNYSFIDNLDRMLYSTAISSSERESTYVIDGVTYSSSIKSDIHSTDTHGYTEVIFAIMYLLGIDFAPRIKNIKRAILYSFKPRIHYEALGYKVLPGRYFNEKIIIEQWDNILRLIATIKLGEVNASQIFKRLNSYSRQHPLYCALKELGRVIKTTFILRYFDDVELRQAIEKQLNKIELSNKFAKAISFDNNNEMQYSSKEEQEMVINCQMLIQNAIILWNELYLSQKLVNTSDLVERAEILAILANGSIQSWGHINFSGEYDFTGLIDLTLSEFDLDKILELKI
jgi:TnpA family transposase